MKDPLISVVVCVYNGERFLNDALKSISVSDYSNFEVVIIDDGSTDYSCSIIQDFCSADKRYRCIKKKNNGLASARNTALINAKGTWIAVLDQDDLMYPQRLRNQLNICLRENTLFCFADTDYIDPNSRVIGSHLSGYTLPHSPIQANKAAEYLIKFGCFIDSESWFMHKSLISKAGLLDEGLTYACDYEYFLRLASYSNFSYLREKVGAWRRHPEQQTRINSRRYYEVFLVYLRYGNLAKKSISTSFWWSIRIVSMYIRWLLSKYR